MISSFDGKWSFKKKFESLLKEIQKQAEIDSKHFVIFIDEIPPEFFESCSEYDSTLNQLHDECSLVHVFMAISPIGRHLTMPLQLNFSDGNKVFVQQLQTRHRNSFPLSAFLIHMTYKYNDFKVKRSIVRAIFQQKSTSKYQCLSPSDDTPLDSSNLPDGDVTLWYHRSNDVTEIEALKFFKETYLPTNGEVLVSPSGKNRCKPSGAYGRFWHTGGMGNPGMGSPGMGNPGMGSPGMGNPGMGSPGMGNPGMGSWHLLLAAIVRVRVVTHNSIA